MRGRTAGALALAIMAPSLAWLALDRGVWPWDQAWFGFHAVTLYETVSQHPLAWPAAMMAATPLKPPLLAWLGQLFVPLGQVLGSVDSALLLTVWGCHLAALIVLLRALRSLAEGRSQAAVAGTLVMGAAPLFVALSTQFLAEAPLVLAVCFFVLLMVRAPATARGRLGAQLVAASAFALLAKTTAPLYCAGPGLVALFHVVARRPAGDTRATAAHERRGDALWWALALSVAAGAVVWYHHNLAMVVLHVRTAGFGAVAELYGERTTFWRAFAARARLAASSFFLWPAGAVVGAAVALGAGQRPRRGWSGADLCGAVALVQVMTALAVCALSPASDPRYAEPLLPLLAVVVTWALSQVTSGRWAIAATAALGGQLLVVEARVLALWPMTPGAQVGLDPAMAILHRDVAPAARLASIVRRTCPAGGLEAFHFVGVDVMEMSGHTLTYAAAKERLAGSAGRCLYESIAFGSLEAGTAVIDARPYVYWITLDPQVVPIPPAHQFLNRTAPVLFRRLRRRGVLQPEPWDGAPPGVLLFRFSRP